MKLREIIKNYRLEHSLTLRDFAELCKMSHSYIAMLEDGKNSKTGQPMIPTLPTLRKIAHAMGMQMNELINDADDMPFGIDANTAQQYNYNDYLRQAADHLGTKAPDLTPFPYLATPKNKQHTEEENLSEGERMMLEVFRLVPDDQQKHVIEMIRTTLKMQGLLK